MRRVINTYITIDSEVCHGKPCFRGTRIPVTVVLELLESGMSIREILRGYPSLNKEAIQAALHYAVSRIEDEEILPIAQ